MAKILFRGNNFFFRREKGFILFYTIILLASVSVCFVALNSLISARFNLAKKEQDSFYEKIAEQNIEEASSYQGIYDEFN